MPIEHRVEPGGSPTSTRRGSTSVTPPHEADRYTPVKGCLKALLDAMKTMQGSQDAFSVRILYGSSPDIAVGAIVKMRNAPTLQCKAVPREVKYLQLICEELVSSRAVDKTALVYRGQSVGAVCEQRRILRCRIHRKQWTPEEKTNIKARSADRCSMCSLDLSETPFEVDHIRALSDGGEDSVENGEVYCLPCHAQ